MIKGRKGVNRISKRIMGGGFLYDTRTEHVERKWGRLGLRKEKTTAGSNIAVVFLNFIVVQDV